MNQVIKPYKADIINNPGIELFVWRIAVFFVFFVLSIVLLVLLFDALLFIKKVAILLCCFTLLLMIFYHLFLILFYKKLRYEITTDSLTIRSFIVHEKFRLSDIKELTEVANETLVLKKRNVFSYFKESPQIVYPVAQLGLCTLEKFGVVSFYSFVDTLKEPKNLVLISTRENKQYAVSPEVANEFINLIRQSETKKN